MVILKEMNYIVFRNRGRTALSVCIAALLVCCMSREFSGAVPRGGRAGRGHVRDGGERAFGARRRDGGEHRV